MNFRLLPTLLLAIATQVFAQEAAPVEPASTPEADAGESLIDPLPALPEPVVGTSESEAGSNLMPFLRAPEPTPRPTPEAEASDEEELAGATIERRIAFRRARTRALADPAVVNAAARIQEAATHPEKRAALGDYYKTLFARIRKLDPTLDPLLVGLEEQIARRLDPVTAREQDIKARAEKKRAAAGTPPIAGPSPSPTTRR